jgi:ORF6N domain
LPVPRPPEAVETLLPAGEERIARSIHAIRDRQVMLDSDLADLYDVATKALNRAVKRNAERFPPDFMFRLTREESESLRCQFGASKPDATEARGGRRYLPFVFKELRVAMLSSVLTSPRAVQMNIAIMRTFVRLRQVMAENRELERRIESVELQQREHASIISVVVEEIQDLRQQPEPPRRRIGF